MFKMRSDQEELLVRYIMGCMNVNITLSPSWSCTRFPITAMDANIHCANMAPDYFVQPQFDYNVQGIGLQLKI